MMYLVDELTPRPVY